MKYTFILAIFSLLFTACGKKNPTADFHVIIPFPESFQPQKIDFGAGEEYASVLYDSRDDVMQILVISKKYYTSSKMFSEFQIKEIQLANTVLLSVLNNADKDEESANILTKEQLEFARAIPEINPALDLPELKMLLNVNNQYGRRLISTFGLKGQEGEYPTLIHALHHKGRSQIIYLQYFRIRDGKGETLEKYDEMMKAIENTRFF